MHLIFQLIINNDLINKSKYNNVKIVNLLIWNYTI